MFVLTETPFSLLAMKKLLVLYICSRTVVAIILIKLCDSSSTITVRPGFSQHSSTMMDVVHYLYTQSAHM